MYQLDLYTVEQIKMSQSQTVSLVKAEESLLVETLDTFVVGPVHWGSEGFVQAHLPTRFNQVRSGFSQGQSAWLFSVLS